MPLPKEDTTPPVTKTNLVMSCDAGAGRCVVVVNGDYRRRPCWPWQRLGALSELLARVKHTSLAYRSGIHRG